MSNLLGLDSAYLLKPQDAIDTATGQVELANQYVADLIRQAGAFT